MTIYVDDNGGDDDDDDDDGDDDDDDDDDNVWHLIMHESWFIKMIMTDSSLKKM